MLTSPQRAGRGPRRKPSNRPVPAATQAPFCGRFLKSAKGAARATKLDLELIAPRSVLREFLKSRTGPGAALQTRSGTSPPARAQAPLCGEFPRSANVSAGLPHQQVHLALAQTPLARHLLDRFHPRQPLLFERPDGLVQRRL